MLVKPSGATIDRAIDEAWNGGAEKPVEPKDIDDGKEAPFFRGGHTELAERLLQSEAANGNGGGGKKKPVEPSEPFEDCGGNIDLAVGTGGTSVQPGAALQPLADEKPWILGAKKDQPKININDDTMLDRAIEVLAECDIFQRSKQLVDVTREGRIEGGVARPVGSPQIRQTPMPRIKELLKSKIRWTHKVKQKIKNEEGIEEEKWIEQRCDIPREVPEMIMARGQWSYVRPLRGITTWPVLRPDGTILSQPGYDPALGLICEPDIEVEVPEHPTREDALAAVEMYRELTSEFPFVDAAHFSSWLAAHLTPFARYAIPGVVPMLIIEATETQTGKTTLADTSGYIVSGRELPRSPAPGNEEEWRKRMLGIGMAGDYCVLFDNIKGVLSSAAFEAVLTAGVFSDRQLGRNEHRTVDILTQFIATLNNGTVSPDIVNRSMLCRLDAKCENPAARVFRRDLLGYCLERRAELIGAALTILRAYILAGKPGVTLRPMNAFRAWSQTVRAPLVWLGLADPAETQVELRAHSSSEGEATADLFNAWHVALGDRLTTAKQLLARLQKTVDLSEREHELRRAIMAFCKVKDGKLPDAVIFGNYLRAARDQVRRGLRLESDNKTAAGTPWRVVKL
jgi:hypothetical protein